MAMMEVKVPDIGDFKDVAVIELLVKPGDTVKAEQSLITVESDKASMEIPSSHAGVVKELKIAIGEAAEHLSLYQLTIEPETPFAGLHAAGGFSRMRPGVHRLCRRLPLPRLRCAQRQTGLDIQHHSTAMHPLMKYLIW